jgi:pimeloyl-ACP methyl ester carboxylesterase
LKAADPWLPTIPGVQSMNQAVIVIGGHNSLWPAYLQMARDLEDLTGLPAIGVPLMPWHWWQAGRIEDATVVVQKLEETVVWARRRFEADRFILVGHSAGGLIARLYLHDGPVWGRTYAGVEHVTAVCTLGSPHCSNRRGGTGWYLTDRANALVPGTPYAGRVYYHALAGHCIQGRNQGTYRERRAFRIYQILSGQGNAWGDGMVPVDCALLEGAERLVLEGVEHSRKVGRNWYGGSKAIIRRWWPDGVTRAP